MVIEKESNFSFLKEHDLLFFTLLHSAERIFAIDPNASLLKVRQFGEAIAQDLAVRAGLLREKGDSQQTLLNRLKHRLDIDPTLFRLFHAIRQEGNIANHQFKTNHKQAIKGLKNARHIAIWYHRSFGENPQHFTPQTFVLPQDPSEDLDKLQQKIRQLEAQLQDHQQSIVESTELASLKTQEASAISRLFSSMSDDAKVYDALLEAQDEEIKQKEQNFEARITQLTEDKERLKQEKEQLAVVRTKTKKSKIKLHLSEAETRELVDQQLMDAGWLADTENLRHANGARPEKGQNKAIAEWPTTTGPADYVLFVGLTPIAIVEAKKQIIDVAGHIPQAERYSSSFKAASNYTMPWVVEGRTIAWVKGESEHYHVPFVYASNGRPYIKQYEEKSGTWFRDVRAPSNLRLALDGFHSPEGLLDKLTRSKEAAEALLKTESFAYLKLRDYQIKAIQTVEKKLAQGERQALLAMATGTGKTRTISGLMYRFLKAERFRRILFLVDRRALGQQANDTFKDIKIEQNQSLSQIYNIAELGDMRAEAETRIQVATVQSMVQRIFQSSTPLLQDEFDCIIVDEAHRGYTLDQEMGEGESLVRDSEQYLSSYRRVLDYFDAFKIGLTATPAAHTSDIFGRPAYTYSYREAVADDWLIDYEPPLTYETQLNQQGIHLSEGEEIQVFDTKNQQMDIDLLEDDIDFDVESFNKRIITESFDEVIAEAFAKEFDPTGPEKAMVFCVNQAHAERFKNKLDTAFKTIYEEDYRQEAVEIITGKTEKVDKAIARYKNETYPTIAITVDLLTTGIDVPTICHLLFVRRVKSRSLYDQMIGRATRRCDDIGKTEFYIHDAVGLYKTLGSVSDMQPIVKDPNITLEQLLEEMQSPSSFAAPGSQEGTSHADDVLNQISQKIMRVLRKATKKAECEPKLQQRLQELEQLWGVEPQQLHKHIKMLGPQQAQQFLRQHGRLVEQLDEVKMLAGTVNNPYIYQGADELINISQGMISERPADYLDAFNDFIKQQLNDSAALKVVCQRPKELTREDLKAVRLLLDEHGFTETKLKTAWRKNTNQDIAASIIGYIRQAALGEALIPFEQRVTHAMQAIYALHQWTNGQRKWLDTLAKQLVYEVVVDDQFINQRFAEQGGKKRLNKILDNHLGQVIEALQEHLWDDVS